MQYLKYSYILKAHCLKYCVLSGTLTECMCVCVIYMYIYLCVCVYIYVYMCVCTLCTTEVHDGERLNLCPHEIETAKIDQ